VKKKRAKVLVEGSTLLKPVLEKLGYNPVNYAVFEAWDRLIGAAAGKARAAGLKDGKLIVDVDASARLHDLTLRKPQLLKKLQGFFGGAGAKPPVSDIIFRISDEDHA
jgi:predicted nucleic acid-binding Zn ribbon protein